MMLIPFSHVFVKCNASLVRSLTTVLQNRFAGAIILTESIAPKIMRFVYDDVVILSVEIVPI